MAELGSYPIISGSPNKTDLIPLTRAGVVLNTPVSALLNDTGTNVFNVKAYGALGDGTTDDTLAIQAAINAVPTEGGEVFFPDGVYIISNTLTIKKHGTWLAGVQMASTFADQINQQPGIRGISVIQASLSHFPVSTPLIQFGELGTNKMWTGGGVRDMNIIGTKGTIDPAGIAIEILNVQAVRVLDNCIVNTGKAVYASSDQSGGLSNIDVDRNIISQTSDVAIHMAVGCQENYVRFNYIHAYTRHGVESDDIGNTVIGNHFESGTLFGTGTADGAPIFSSGPRSFIYDNDILDSPSFGIYVNSSHTNVVANHVNNANESNVANGSGIWIANDIIDVAITGNSINDNDNHMVYGIYDTCFNNHGVTIQANKITGYTTAPVHSDNGAFANVEYPYQEFSLTTGDSLVQEAVRITNRNATSTGRTGLGFYNSSGNVVMARLSAAAGGSFADPKLFFEVADSTGMLQVRAVTNSAGLWGLNGITNPTASLHLPASLSSAASLRIPAGVAPSSPNDGDIWHEGAIIKAFLGGATVAIAPPFKPANFIVAPFGDTRPSDYTCASATGNEVEINAAITAANALTNGGIVELLDGNYTVSNPINPLSNVWIRGRGMFATRIGITSAANCNIMANRTIYSGSNPWTNGIISDLTLDGSGLATNSTVGKGIDGVGALNCKLMRLYVHDTVATGIGFDDYQSCTVTECIVQNCGYNNKHVITGASWSSNVFTFTTSDPHGYAAWTAASGTLTSTGAVNDGDQVVIGTVTYTFKTVLTGAAFEVLINGSAANALANLKKAVNVSGTAGTDYGTGTIGNNSVTASTLTATTLLLVSKGLGSSGNSIVTTTTGANLSFGGATMSGGVTGNKIVVAGMIPALYNNVYNVTSIIDTHNFTVDITTNTGLLNFGTNPGMVTTFGTTSDSLIGHNGIGIASGAQVVESVIVTNNICIGNQNNNYLIEVNAQLTGQNATYIFSNNVSVLAGQAGFRNTGSLNTLFNNNFDYGSPVGCFLFASPGTKTITVATWNAGVATFTTSVNHNFKTGMKVQITGITPIAWQGYYTITSTPLTNTFTVAIASNPGTAVLTAGPLATITLDPIDGTQVINNIFSNNQYFGIEAAIGSNHLMIKNNTIKNCLFYGILSNAAYTQFQGNEIYLNGADGIKLTNGGFQLTSQIDISNNLIYNNGTTAANTFDGINFNAGTTSAIQHVTVSNNHIYDDQDTKTQRYGINLRSGGLLNNLMISGNELVGNLNFSILVQNTSDTIYLSNNAGFNPVGKSDLGNISGSTTFDCTLASYFTATLTGDISPVIPISSAKGTVLSMELKQDSSGSHLSNWPSNFKKAGGTLTLSTGANATDIVTMQSDGTNWVEVSRSLNVS